MQSIIIPIDFTAKSHSALNYIAELYHKDEVRIIMVHAYTSLKTSEFLISIDDIIENDLRQKLELESSYLKRKMNSEKIELVFYLERNDIISTISNAALKYSADVVILGSENEISWSDSNYTEVSHTMTIVKNSSIPCLIVPLVKDLKKPKKILFATVLNGIQENAEVKALIDIVTESQAHLDIVNVSTDSSSIANLDQELRNTVDDFFTDLDYELHTVLDTNIYSGIESFSKQHENDLICIMYRKHGILEKLLNKSVSKQMLSHLEKPILALKHAHQK